MKINKCGCSRIASKQCYYDGIYTITCGCGMAVTAGSDAEVVGIWNKANPSEAEIIKKQTDKFRTMLRNLAYNWRHSGRDMEGIEKVINKFNKEFVKN